MMLLFQFGLLLASWIGAIPFGPSTEAHRVTYEAKYEKTKILGSI